MSFVITNFAKNNVDLTLHPANHEDVVQDKKPITASVTVLTPTLLQASAAVGQAIIHNTILLAEPKPGSDIDSQAWVGVAESLKRSEVQCLMALTETVLDEMATIVGPMVMSLLAPRLQDGKTDGRIGVNQMVQATRTAPAAVMLPLENGTDATPAAAVEGESSGLKDAATTPKRASERLNTLADERGLTKEQAAAFINVFGDVRLTQALEMMRKALLEACITNMKSSANFGELALSMAILAGEKGVDARKKELTGAITGGVFNVAMTAGNSLRTSKAIRSETKAHSSNFNKVKELQKQKFELSGSIDSMQQKPTAKNLKVQEDKLASITKKQGDLTHDMEVLHSNNQANANKTARVRAEGEIISATGRVSDNVIQGVYGTQAAQDNKLAEEKRTEKDIANDIGNTERKNSKSAEDLAAFMLQIARQVAEKTSNTFAEVAGNIRA